LAGFTRTTRDEANNQITHLNLLQCIILRQADELRQPTLANATTWKIPGAFFFAMKVVLSKKNTKL